LIDRTGEDDIGNAVDLCFTPVLQEEKHAPFRFMILNLKIWKRRSKSPTPETHDERRPQFW